MMIGVGEGWLNFAQNSKFKDETRDYFVIKTAAQQCYNLLDNSSDQCIFLGCSWMTNFKSWITCLYYNL